MKNRLILFSLIFLSFSIVAQDKLNVQEVNVVEEYLPKIAPSRKINDIPQIIDTIKEVRKFYYTVIPKYYRTSYHIDTIKPAKIKGEPIHKIYNTYLKFGLGNSSLPFFEGYYNSLRSKKFNYGFELGYHNSVAKAKGFDASFHKNKISGYGKSIFDFGVMNIDFSRLGNVYSAHGSQSNLEDNQMRQYWAYSQFNLSLESKHHFKDQLRYFTKLHLSDLNERTENNVSFYSSLKKRFGRYDYSIAFNLDYYTNNISNGISFLDDLYKEGIYTLSPRITGNFYGLKMIAGFDEVINNKMTETVGLNFYFYPQLRLEYAVIPNLFNIYMGFRSGLQKNSYWNLSIKNPFILNTLSYDGGVVELRNTNTNLASYLGINTYLGSDVNFDLEFCVAKKKNMPFFSLNEFSLWNNKFDVVYQDGIHLDLYSNIIWNPIDGKGVELVLKYNYFSSSELGSLGSFYLPVFHFGLNPFYNLGDKIIGHIDLYASFGRRYTNAIENLDDGLMRNIVDFDVMIEYRYTRLLSAYLKASRVIGGYEIWENYPVISPQIQIGFSYQL